MQKAAQCVKVYKGDIVVRDTKLQRSLFFTITKFQPHHYTVSRVLLTMCNGEVSGT